MEPVLGRPGSDSGLLLLLAKRRGFRTLTANNTTQLAGPGQINEFNLISSYIRSSIYYTARNNRLCQLFCFPTFFFLFLFFFLIYIRASSSCLLPIDFFCFGINWNAINTLWASIN